MNAENKAENYEAWCRDAQIADEKSGAESWKSIEKTPIYDHKIIRKRFDELKEIRAAGDIRRLLFYLNEGVHGNMAGMGAPKLYSHAQFGTKHLVSDYVSELVAALTELAESESRAITKKEKVAYFRRASMGFGRTALMLSGAGSFGGFHLGAIKAMTEENVLPRVISGASTGAYIAGLVCSMSPEDRQQLFRSENLSHLLDFNAPSSGRRVIDLYDLESLLHRTIPDLTFQEAYEVSNLHLNISVAPGTVQQRSRLLNAITSPNACIREAILASCSIPGLFPAVTLAAKDSVGKRQNYIPSRTWVDGSIMDELPAKRLTRLYGVNHTISSQIDANTRADPMLLTPFHKTGAAMYQSAMREWLKDFYPAASAFVKDSYPLNVMARNWFSSMMQEYDADIEITSRRHGHKAGNFFETLTPEETCELISEGERATWPLLERIRTTSAVARQIDTILLSWGQDTLLP